MLDNANSGVNRMKFITLRTVPYIIYVALLWRCRIYLAVW